LIGAFLLWRSLSQSHQTAAPNGKALALVTGMVPCPLTTFVLSYAVARNVLAAGLAVTAAMTVGMIGAIGSVALLAALAKSLFMALLARTETLRHRIGMGLEIGGAFAVLGLGLLMIART
jgi:nickel/cobalt exporter